MSETISNDDEQGDDVRRSFISKSKFLWGLQCPKLLRTAYKAKHLIPESRTLSGSPCSPRAATLQHQAN